MGLLRCMLQSFWFTVPDSWSYLRRPFLPCNRLYATVEYLGNSVDFIEAVQGFWAWFDCSEPYLYWYSIGAWGNFIVGSGEKRWILNVFPESSRTFSFPKSIYFFEVFALLVQCFGEIMYNYWRKFHSLLYPLSFKRVSFPDTISLTTPDPKHFLLRWNSVPSQQKQLEFKIKLIGLEENVRKRYEWISLLKMKYNLLGISVDVFLVLFSAKTQWKGLFISSL